jgi:hypothetical protein
LFAEEVGAYACSRPIIDAISASISSAPRSLVGSFHWTRDFRIRGRTPTERATVLALGMNRPAVIAIRKMLLELGLISIEND